MNNRQVISWKSKDPSSIQKLSMFTLKRFREGRYKNVSLLNVISFVSIGGERVLQNLFRLSPHLPNDTKGAKKHRGLHCSPWDALEVCFCLNIVYLGADHIVRGKSHKILAQHLSLSAGIGLLVIRSFTSLSLFHANTIQGYTFHLWTLRQAQESY